MRDGRWSDTVHQLIANGRTGVFRALGATIALTRRPLMISRGARCVTALRDRLQLPNDHTLHSGRPLAMQYACANGVPRPLYLITHSGSECSPQGIVPFPVLCTLSESYVMT